MKGIILAGGLGTRLYPLTKQISKHLLPIGGKPMIFYPLNVLMSAGIKDILIISTPRDLLHFKRLFGDGKQYGISLSYATQPQPNGIAEAFIIGEKFISGDQCALILGDNLFYGPLEELLIKATAKKHGATVFAYEVEDPHRFGIVEIGDNGKVLSIEEKPNEPKSNYALTGLYFYDNKAVEYAKTLNPSNRGELEITDLNNIYLNEGTLEVEVLGAQYTWLDVGTKSSLYMANQLKSC